MLPLSPPSQHQTFTKGSLRKAVSFARGQKGGAANLDRKQLAELGFHEELTRDWDFWACWGIGICNIGFLPGTYYGLLTAWQTGGGSMYSFAWPLSGLFMLALAGVLGEMASAYPVAGAMFTWTFRLSRSSKWFNSSARYNSWIVGSFLLAYHIIVQILVAYQLARGILSIVGLYVPDYDLKFWHTVLIAWAALISSAFFVSSRFSRSPRLWQVCGALTFVGWFVIIVVLLAKAPRIRSAKAVFTSYENVTGWNSKGYTYLIGWVLTCVASGMEACAHMAEDTKSPSRTVPMAMFWSVAASYIFGWILICVLLATIRTDNMDPSLATSVTLLNNTLSRSWTTFLLVTFLVFFAFQNVAQLLASSRFIWALARESALPFSKFFHFVAPGQRQPRNAIWTIVLIAAPSLLLLRINQELIGTILMGGGGWAVMFSYSAPVVIYLFTRKDAMGMDGRAQWTLRSWSKPLAGASVAFASLFLIVICWPTTYPVTPLTASYASVFAAAVAVLATLTWVFYGNSHFAGPIKATTRWTIGAEIELPSSSGRKSTSGPGRGPSSSAAVGRTAVVFSSFPALMSDDPPSTSRGPMSEGDEEYYTETDGTGTSAFSSRSREGT